MRKKQIAVIVSLVLLLSATIPVARAEEQCPVTYTGETFMVVNDSLHESGWFAAAQTGMGIDAVEGEENAETGGKIMSRMESLRPIGTVETCKLKLMEDTAADYRVSDEWVLRVVEENTILEKRMICLHVGEFCTVWGCLDDEVEIQLQSSQAAQIGKDFDSHMFQMEEAFGDHWWDADGDHKVALMCYNVDGEALLCDDQQYISGFRAGYFYMRDLIQKDGSIGKWQYASDSYLNGMDLLHVDTYPGMGNGSNYLGDISACYPTLVHEFQHLINFTYTAESGDVRDEMEPYLNEAFSMAAEQLVFGFDAVKSRVAYFNSEHYRQGTSLTQWKDDLSSYANAYLFGQYLRTQYAQEKGDKSDGHEIYLDILKARSNGNGTSNHASLSIAAELLGIQGDDAEQMLVERFWKAVFLKEESGPYGFGGENWAYSIVPEFSPLTAADCIEAGGVKYYQLPEEGVTVYTSENVSFSVLDRSSPLVENTLIWDYAVSYSEDGAAQLVLEANQKTSVYSKACVNHETEAKRELEFLMDLPELTACSINLPNPPDGGRICVSFFLKNEASETEIVHVWLGGEEEVRHQTERREVGTIDLKINRKNNVIDLGISPASDSVPYSGEVFVICYDDHGKMLECHSVAVKNNAANESIVCEEDLSACMIKLFFVDPDGAPVAKQYEVPRF